MADKVHPHSLLRGRGRCVGCGRLGTTIYIMYIKCHHHHAHGAAGVSALHYEPASSASMPGLLSRTHKARCGNGTSLCVMYGSQQLLAVAGLHSVLLHDCACLHQLISVLAPFAETLET